MGTYQVQPLSLGLRDLWSDGKIQLLHFSLAEDTRQTLYCIGKISHQGWQPILVQGKVGYAFTSPHTAHQICASLNQPPYSIG